MDILRAKSGKIGQNQFFGRGGVFSQEMNNCTCMKAQDQLFKFFHKWVTEQSDNTIFYEDLIHIVFEYHCSKVDDNILWDGKK